MKVLVADRFEQSGLDGLATPGCEVVYAPKLQGAARQNQFVRPSADDAPGSVLISAVEVVGALSLPAIPEISTEPPRPGSSPASCVVRGTPCSN
jgi:hypothetical protein